MTIKTVKTPRFVSHPWKTLKAFLEWKNISQRQFAKIIDKTPTEVNNIITGQKNINPEFAIRIGIALWTSAELRLNLQNKYDLYQLNTLKEKKNAFESIKKRSLAFA